MSLRIVLAPAARSDMCEVMLWSKERFGESAASRYRDLLKQALRDVAKDPERPGSKERSDLAAGVRTYHLYFSRDRARGDMRIVKNPRHFLVYRCTYEGGISIIRILHDARDLERHVPEDNLSV